MEGGRLCSSHGCRGRQGKGREGDASASCEKIKGIPPQKLHECPVHQERLQFCFCSGTLHASKEHASVARYTAIGWFLEPKNTKVMRHVTKSECNSDTALAPRKPQRNAPCFSDARDNRKRKGTLHVT